jgi:hypothetical protein
MLRLALLLLFWAGAGVAAAQTAFPTRLTISTTFVSNGDPGVDVDLKTWNSLLTTQFSNLVNDSRYNLANAHLLNIERAKFEPALPDQPTLQRRWEQSFAIQIIAGSGLRSGETTVFDGWVYMGDLAPDPRNPQVHLRQPIRAASYTTSRDAVALSALYALSVDAGQTRSVACPLLAEANLIRRDLAASHTDVADLAHAVDKRLLALNCRPAR